MGFGGHVKRREFITFIGVGVAWPLTVRAQQGDRTRHIGVLLGYVETDPETKLRIGAFRLGLEKRGWSEGRNIQIDYRFVPANMTQRDVLVKELWHFIPRWFSHIQRRWQPLFSMRLMKSQWCSLTSRIRSGQASS